MISNSKRIRRIQNNPALYGIKCFDQRDIGEQANVWGTPIASLSKTVSRFMRFIRRVTCDRLQIIPCLSYHL